MKIDKFSDKTFEEGVYCEHFHPTFNELLEEIDRLHQNATENSDKSLLESLKEFYLTSDIFKAAGNELLKIKRPHNSPSSD